MGSASDNPLVRLQSFGQSVWLDYICRDILDDGTLERLIDNDGLSGVTSNPAIFERAITSGAYEKVIRECKSAGMAPAAIYEQIAIGDIRAAARLLLPVYAASGRRDGFVSLEVSPHLADDTEATCDEARRLWSLVDHPNLMIKVPATSAGLPAIATLTGEGLNVNVTLLFSRDVYRDVMEAYVSGMAHWRKQGGDPRAVASVASFFVSRIDTAVDRLVDEAITDASGDAAGRLASLKGKAAIASAKMVYQDCLGRFAADDWRSLARAGARTQRLLWGSTSTKNPEYRDVRYVEELIGPETVNTVPMPTLDAFRDHGVPRPSLTEGIDDAAQVLAVLPHFSISLDVVTDRLTREGVKLFCQAYDKVLAALS